MLRRIYADNAHRKPDLSKAITVFCDRKRYPRYIVKNRATQLGITVDRRNPWKCEDLEKLRELAGSKSTKAIAKALGRGHSSVKSMLDSLHISRRVTMGYTRQEAALVLGCSADSIAQSISKGWLKVAPSSDRITEASMEKFLRQHPERYSLKRVDETWFKGMLFPYYGLNVIGRVAKENQRVDVESGQEMRA